MSSDPSATPVASSSRGSTNHSLGNSSNSNGSAQTSSRHDRMVQTKVWTKQEYVDLLPRFSKSDFERFKKSIKGLLMPIILNQDNVVLDGHRRMRARLSRCL